MPFRGPPAYFATNLPLVQPQAWEHVSLRLGEDLPAIPAFVIRTREFNRPRYSWTVWKRWASSWILGLVEYFLLTLADSVRALDCHMRYLHLQNGFSDIQRRHHWLWHVSQSLPHPLTRWRP